MSKPMTLSDTILWVESLPDRERHAIKQHYIRRDIVHAVIENAFDDVVNENELKPNRLDPSTELHTTQ